MKKILGFFIIVVLLSSCWAPRCPVDSCHVKFEHVHSDYVSGVFNGRSITSVPKLHFLWDKDKGVEKRAELKTSSGKKKKYKYKFPWEKW